MAGSVSAGPPRRTEGIVRAVPSPTCVASGFSRKAVAVENLANPDNLALDKNGNRYITEDTTTPPGMDIWVAVAAGGDTSGGAATRSPFHPLPASIRRTALASPAGALIALGL